MRNGGRSDDGSEQNHKISGAQPQSHGPGSELPPSTQTQSPHSPPKENKIRLGLNHVPIKSKKKKERGTYKGKKGIKGPDPWPGREGVVYIYNNYTKSTAMNGLS